MTLGERPWHRHWDGPYAHGLAHCRGVLIAPILRELDFIDVEREYLVQATFPTELITARTPPTDSAPIARAGAQSDATRGVIWP
jgi:hypothetical protein